MPYDPATDELVYKLSIDAQQTLVLKTLTDEKVVWSGGVLNCTGEPANVTICLEDNETRERIKKFLAAGGKRAALKLTLIALDAT